MRWRERPQSTRSIKSANYNEDSENAFGHWWRCLWLASRKATKSLRGGECLETTSWVENIFSISSTLGYELAAQKRNTADRSKKDTRTRFSNRRSVQFNSAGKDDLSDYDFCGTMPPNVRFATGSELGLSESAANTRWNHSDMCLERQGFRRMGRLRIRWCVGF